MSKLGRGRRGGGGGGSVCRKEVGLEELIGGGGGGGVQSRISKVAAVRLFFFVPSHHLHAQHAQKTWGAWV